MAHSRDRKIFKQKFATDNRFLKQAEVVQYYDIVIYHLKFRFDETKGK